jgi:ergothioneine biosynthesis protein EgtB
MVYNVRSLATGFCMSTPQPRIVDAGRSLAERYRCVRDRSLRLCSPLGPEDMTVQSMPDASPAKWHLAHTTWFFERFILQPNCPDYRVFNEHFDHLFNSYYFTVGQMYARPRRGLISRPTVGEVIDWRRHVDDAMAAVCADADERRRFLVVLGLNHEQQHQELLLTDIKHMLAQNPMFPAYDSAAATASGDRSGLRWIGFPGGLQEIGAPADRGFVFDNETPPHRVWLEEFELASRPVTNGEFLEFVEDGGYASPALWLSDGWSTVQSSGWCRPLYWQDDGETMFTLGGLKPFDPAAPVCHLSYYEADAYARWSGARLPTEAEWETASGREEIRGNFVESGHLHPVGTDGAGLQQCYGDVWEWTSSPYAPYPGFEPLEGSLGEYNGKFMCSQMVLRGGSCATPADHIRPTYRNFFYPHQRWQFSGVRLARSPA